ncbi:MAG: Rieske (2Fe-2S) protein [Candidatus Bathyarchaeia archaeon]|jgi:nitrite reductase/ring-hydroxylating ferredoxin subunit
MLVKLCDKTLLAPGELRSFKVRDREILAVNISGIVFCLDGRCTHAGAPLVEGSLEGEVLTCPWHYSQFKITGGEVLHGPAYKPLKIYRVEEKENAVYIDL